MEQNAISGSGGVSGAIVNDANYVPAHDDLDEADDFQTAAEISPFMWKSLKQIKQPKFY